MTDLEQSAREREECDFDLFGDSPTARRISAQIIVAADERIGQATPQWVIDVAEGRLPA